MAIVLYNPTNEDLQTQYVGEDVIVRAGTKVRVDDPRGRQVLNVLGPRGLVTLEYGDEGGGEDKKAQDGIQRNKDFKYKQVIEFNTLNEQRFQGRLPYLRPQEHIKRYANELGIELRQPYAVADAAKKDMSEAMQRNESLERENRKKDSEIQELRSQVSELTAQFRMFLQRANVDDGNGAKDLIGKWKTMGAKTLAPWIDKNWEGLMMLSDADKKDLEDRFSHVYSKPLPAEKESLAAMA